MDLQTVAVFGGSGKIGQRVVSSLLERNIRVQALVHRNYIPGEGVESFRGSISDPLMVRNVVQGCDAVIHLATAKEDPETFFDVSIRGTFNVVEACRAFEIKQLILLGGDAAFGIWFNPHPVPITETHPHMAYPGYYAFSKVIEEVMAQQYWHQYQIPYTILRSSWVFERADLLQHFSLLKNVDPAEPGHGFGEQPEEIMQLVEQGKEHIPVLVDSEGEPYRRHIVQIDDLIQSFDLVLGNDAALNESFNIAAPAAFQYREAADYLAGKMNLPTLEIACPGYHSFEISIDKARSVLGYDPKFDFQAMADSALEYANR